MFLIADRAFLPFCLVLTALTCFSGCALTPAPLTPDDGPLNAAYLFNGRKIQLSGGKFERQAAPESVTVEKYSVHGTPVYGDLDGNGVEDAALIIIHSPGGTGTFYYAAAVIQEGGRYRGTNTLFLGDRIVPEALLIKDQHVIVSYLDRRPSEPMIATPNVGKRLSLVLAEGILSRAPPYGEEYTGRASPATLGELEGLPWTLVRFYAEGREIFAASPGTPTLAVNGEGHLSGMAAINRYFGQVTLDETGRLTWLGPLGATMMAGTKEQMKQELLYLSSLQRVSRAFFRDGRLVLQDETAEFILEFIR
jgi:heat shock protein HslJ